MEEKKYPEYFLRDHVPGPSRRLGTYFRNQSPFILDPHLCKTAKFESSWEGIDMTFVSIAHPWTVQFT